MGREGERWRTLGGERNWESEKRKWGMRVRVKL
jgi:hypothetical protein